MASVAREGDARHGDGSCSWGTAALVGVVISVVAVALLCLAVLAGLPTLATARLIGLFMCAAVVVIGMRLDRRRITPRYLLLWFLWLAAAVVLTRAIYSLVPRL